MTEIRCKKCNRLLFKTEDLIGYLEIKCPKCGFMVKINTIDYGCLNRRSPFADVPLTK